MSMRTTIRLEDELLQMAKQHALNSNRTFTQLVNDALIALIERERAARSPRTISLPTFGGDGIQLGVDMNSSASILEAMDRDSGTSTLGIRP